MEETINAIRSFLSRSSWLKEWDSISFLAAGEYNENYLIRSKEGSFVFRINHGSQLGLQRQIEYEYRVLEAVWSSGVTPKPAAYDQEAEEFPRGMLLMEYLPGKTFEYTRDLLKAAGVFASVHTVKPDARLIRQEDPVMDIARESLELINRFEDHPRKELRSRLLRYHETITDLAESTKGIFRGEELCIVNTEVNSGNFIVGKEQTFLVDWEKAVCSYRYQDLGHFLVPTTTLWKSNVVISREERKKFLKRYRALLHVDLSIEEIDEKTALLEKTILLRALSWCYMAYYEYTYLERNLRNEYTFKKIRTYLDEYDRFI